jgi:hypothetical protein
MHKYCKEPTHPITPAIKLTILTNQQIQNPKGKGRWKNSWKSFKILHKSNNSEIMPVDCTPFLILAMFDEIRELK